MDRHVIMHIRFHHLVIAAFIWWLRPEPDPRGPQQALTSIGLLILSVGLSLLAGYLLSRKNKATIKDDKPTTLTTRGSFVNWVIGIRRVGPIFAWAGDRKTKKEKSGKKGVGSSPKVKIFFESGWHLLCVGEAFCLHRILQNGKVIFQGPITKDSHPSGTFIDLGSEGGFHIYWGGVRQPANTILGDASRVGITSRWPFHCYVLWVEKRLGQAAQWPLLDYEIEKRPEISETVLSSTSAFMKPTRTLDGPTRSIFDFRTTPSDHFVVDKNRTADFPIKSLVRLAGNALPDQDLNVTLVDTIQEGGGVRTRIFVAEDLTGADDAGTLQAYTDALDAGINAAHAIADMLFAPFPHGLGFPTTGALAPFDLPSLETAGVLWDENNENLRTSWISTDGDSAQTVLGAGLQDLGTMLPISNTNGLLKFTPVREPTGTLPRIRDDLLVGVLPEIETFHGVRPVDKLVFAFPDRNISDRDGTIAVMDDGSVSYTEQQHARVVQITITTQFTTASTIAQRRSQEELAGGSKVQLRTNRSTRTLLPGDAVTVDALPEVQRVEQLKLDSESGEVILDLIIDMFGVAKSPFVDTPPPETGRFKPVEPDLAKEIVEVPEYISLGDPPTAIFPRIRAHEQISKADIHISRDNVTYVLQGEELNLQTGGTLDAELSATGLMLLEQGPVITELGPDISIVDDLSSDLTNWRLGKQLAVISSSAGIEICFLRNITAMGGSQWRLDGLIRARFDTVQLTHPAGANVFIFKDDEIFSSQDALLQPQQPLFLKTQPFAGGTLPLSGDVPVTLTLYGKGSRPIPIGNLTVTAPVLGAFSYTTGSDVTFRWAYGTPQTQSAGAGLQPAGTAISGLPAVDGDFKLEILTTGDVVVRTVTQTATSFVYTNANLISDLGSEVDFKVRVTQRRGGQEAAPVTRLVEIV